MCPLPGPRLHRCRCVHLWERKSFCCSAIIARLPTARVILFASLLSIEIPRIAKVCCRYMKEVPRFYHFVLRFELVLQRRSCLWKALIAGIYIVEMCRLLVCLIVFPCGAFGAGAVVMIVIAISRQCTRCNGHQQYSTIQYSTANAV